MPIGRCIDGDHWFAEPHLGRGGEPHHAEIGADLDKRIGVAAVAVQFDQLVSQYFRRHFGDTGPALELQADVANDLEAELGEIAPHLGVGDRILWRQERDALDTAIGFQRRRARMRADADAHASFVFDLALERVGARHAVQIVLGEVQYHADAPHTLGLLSPCRK